MEMSKTNKKIINLLNQIDILVDGKFILEQKSLSVIFRGSKNQRILDVKKSLEAKKAIDVEEYKEKKEEKKDELMFI